jgi:hypothetical protein
MYAAPPSDFRLVTSPAEACENRRLPGTTTTTRSSMVLVLNDRKPWMNASRWVILGNRPLRHSMVDTALR